VGSGGSLGAIQYRDLARELARGYATIATDNGHRSEAYDVSWRWAVASASWTSGTEPNI